MIVRQKITVRVCGDEIVSVTLPALPVPFYKYEFNSGTKTPYTVTNLFTWETKCPVTGYTLETESGGVYTAYSGA